MTGLAYLGPGIDHQDSLRFTARKAGVPLTLLPDSVSWLRQHATHRPGKLAARIQRVQVQIAGTQNADYLKHVLDRIDSQQITHILAYWGTLPLPDLRAIRRHRPKIRIALAVLCHPLGLTPWPVRLQHFVLGRSIPDLDALIVSSDTMGRYLAKHISGAALLPTYLHRPCWSEEYSVAREPGPLAERPNVIFLGRMDWKRGQPSDNVTASLRELMQQGIDVNFCRSAESEIAAAHALPFDPVPLRELSGLAAPFDCSLITYNLDVVAVPDRFQVTVPDRVLSSVAAGLPIALPAKGYQAVREFLADYEAVLSFTSMAHLAEQLRDRDRIADLRSQALGNSGLYRAEREFPGLVAFLEGL